MNIVELRLLHATQPPTGSSTVQATEFSTAGWMRGEFASVHDAVRACFLASQNRAGTWPQMPETDDENWLMSIMGATPRRATSPGDIIATTDLSEIWIVTELGPMPLDVESAYLLRRAVKLPASSAADRLERPQIHALVAVN